MYHTITILENGWPITSVKYHPCFVYNVLLNIVFNVLYTVMFIILYTIMHTVLYAIMYYNA